MEMNDMMSGYKKIKNEQNLTIDSLLQMITDVPFSQGKPRIGKVAKKEAIVWEPVGNYQVYIYVGKNIDICCACVKSVGKNLLKELAVGMVTDANSTERATAERAVDEVYEVLKKRLVDGDYTTESGAAAKAKEVYYMKQAVVAIADKYAICREDQTPVYYVKSNLISLNYKIYDSHEQLLMEMKRKVIALMPEFILVKEKKTIGSVKKKLKLTRPEVTGKINGKEIQMLGDLQGYHFTIKADGKVIGNVDTQRLTWGDCYSIEIMDSSMKDVIITLAVAIDKIIDSAK